jgi:cytochrome c556
MKHFIIFTLLLFSMVRCSNELAFEDQSFQRKTTLPCKENCPHISVKIPVAKDVPIVADSINKKIFSVLKEIIYFGEKPYTSTNYNGLLASFIDSYEKLQKEFPKDTFGWEAEIEGSLKYQSDSILNIEIKHYTYTGGAHGYQGLRSLIFDPDTGKSISNDELFKDKNAFKAFAEKKFRAKYKIPANKSINSTGLMFEDEKFYLPQNIFYTDKGLLLYYNPYEAASYADGPKELLLSYKDVNDYLAIK